MQMIFDSNNTEGVLLVAACTAFNSLNCASTLHNVQVLCPCLTSALTNIYQKDAKLFVAGETILPQEGTTQGDSLVMAMHGCHTADPGSKHPRCQATMVCRRCYPRWTPTPIKDIVGQPSWCGSSLWVPFEQQQNMVSGESRTSTRKQRESLMKLEFVPLVQGSIILEQPLEHFQTFIKEYVQEKVKVWKTELNRLSLIAKSEPHAAFSALTHGLIGHWMYFLRTIEGITPLQQPIEDSIRQHYLPALTGQNGVSDLESELLGLPPRHGGLGLVNPTTLSTEHTLSLCLTAPLTAIIVLQKGDIGTPDNSNNPSSHHCIQNNANDNMMLLLNWRPNCPNTCRELMNWPVKRVPTAGWLPSQLLLMAVSPQNMPSHVQLEGSPSFRTMKCMTSQPTFSLRYAMMSVSNHAYNRSRGWHSLLTVPQLRTMLD